MVDKLVSQKFFEVRPDFLQPRHAIDYVTSQMKTVNLVQNRHIERSGRGPFLLVSADVQIIVIVSPVGEPVNQPRVAVIGEDDWLVSAEHRIELQV